MSSEFSACLLRISLASLNRLVSLDFDLVERRLVLLERDLVFFLDLVLRGLNLSRSEVFLERDRYLLLFESDVELELDLDLVPFLLGSAAFLPAEFCWDAPG